MKKLDWYLNYSVLILVLVSSGFLLSIIMYIRNETIFLSIILSFIVLIGGIINFLFVKGLLENFKYLENKINEVK